MERRVWSSCHEHIYWGSWGERYLKRGGRGEESELLLLLVAQDELACIEAEPGEIKCLDAYQLILSSVPEWLLVIRMQPQGDAIIYNPLITDAYGQQQDN